MTEPIRPADESGGGKLEKETRAAEPVEATWLTGPYADERYLVPEVEVAPPVYHKERLFSRKVLIGWAAATLTLWFLIRFVAPVVMNTVGETVRETVIDRLHDRGVNVKVNGRTVTPTIPAIPPIPPIPAIPPVPAVPAAAGVTAKPAPQAVPAPATGSRGEKKKAPETTLRR